MSQTARHEPPVLGFLVAVVVFALALFFVARARHIDAPTGETAETTEPGPSGTQPVRRTSPSAGETSEPGARDDSDRRDRPGESRYTYTPVSDLRRTWTLKLSPEEHRSKPIQALSTSTLDEWIGPTADGAWAYLQFLLVTMTKWGSMIDAEGRLHPISEEARRTAWQSGESALAEQIKRIAPPKLRPELRRKIRTEWHDAFLDCLRWESTGMCRMRSDGALEAEFRLLLDMEQASSRLPPGSSCFTKQELELLAKSGTNPQKEQFTSNARGMYPLVEDVMVEALVATMPLEIFCSILSSRKSDADRRELINNKYHLTVLQMCRGAWSKDTLHEVDHPHKWAVVVDP
jgi:hypothetical protein